MRPRKIIFDTTMQVRRGRSPCLRRLLIKTITIRSGPPYWRPGSKIFPGSFERFITSLTCIASCHFRNSKVHYCPSPVLQRAMPVSHPYIEKNRSARRVVPALKNECVQVHIFIYSFHETKFCRRFGLLIFDRRSSQYERAGRRRHVFAGTSYWKFAVRFTP